jgi:plastocyanin
MAMTTVNRTSEPPLTHHDDARGDRRSRVGWRRLQAAAAWAAIASFTVPMIIDRSIEGFLVAMLAPFMIGLLLRMRWPRVGAIWLGVVSLAELLFSMPFLAEALTHPETPRDFMPLMTFSLAIAVGSIAATPAVRQGRRPDLPSRSATIVAATAIVVFVTAVTVSVVATAGVDSTPAQAGDIQLTTTDFRFSPNIVTTADGTIAITVTNDDTTRHTFTIDEFDVDMNVPPGTTQRVTFTADAGTYRFYCRPHVPGMAGSLVVQ